MFVAGVEAESVTLALRRLNRAVDAETEPWHQRVHAGAGDGTAGLRAIGFHLLELGFTIAEAGGIDCATIEAAVSTAYDLPQHTA